ncbi:MAG TPA: DUF3169 family protein [Candidatus Fimimorpha excrementavium]|nr:DUF3169 family protein [Candidatus Fimimorpha excrementavium]
MKKKARKENPRRSFLLFFLIMIISMIIGGIGGGLMVDQQKSVEDILQTVFNWMEQGSGWAALGVTVVGMTASAGVYLWCRREAKAWDGEDEKYIERVEDWLSMGQIMMNIVMILSFCLDAMAFSGLFETAEEEWMRLLIPLMDLIVVLAFIVILQRSYVELAKRINPEKRGDTFDFNFQKTWLESCDEQEQMIIYKSSYRSFRAMQTVFPICWCVLLMLSIAVEIGVIPFLLIGVLWMIHTMTYYMGTMKAYGKGRKNKK